MGFIDFRDINMIEVDKDDNPIDVFELHLEDSDGSLHTYKIRNGVVDGKAIIRHHNGDMEIFYVKDGAYNGIYRKFRNNKVIKKIVYLNDEIIETILNEDQYDYDPDELPF
jgi:hypothetical protein